MHLEKAVTAWVLSLANLGSNWVLLNMHSPGILLAFQLIRPFPLVDLDQEFTRILNELLPILVYNI